MEGAFEPFLPIRSVGDRFAGRSEAGALLAERLRHRVFQDPLILALPRGGVPVAYEVARQLEMPMEVLVAGKVAAPESPEYALGAAVEGGLYHLNHAAIEAMRIPEAKVEQALEKQRDEIRRRIALYRLDLPLPRVKNRDVIVIDDGIATGETARVACKLLRDRHARRVILAVPVCPADFSVEEDFPEADELVALLKPEDFRAVGQFYARFSSVSDDAVVHLASRGRTFGLDRSEGSETSPRSMN